MCSTTTPHGRRRCDLRPKIGDRLLRSSFLSALFLDGAVGGLFRCVGRKEPVPPPSLCLGLAMRKIGLRGRERGIKKAGRKRNPLHLSVWRAYTHVLARISPFLRPRRPSFFIPLLSLCALVRLTGTPTPTPKPLRSSIRRLSRLYSRNNILLSCHDRVTRMYSSFFPPQRERNPILPGETGEEIAFTSG